MIELLDTGCSNLRAYENILSFLNLNYTVCSSGAMMHQEKLNTILLPGVSNFGTLSKSLDDRQFTASIRRRVTNGSPIIGTCSGMQILFESSEECPNSQGLGLVKGEVKKFPMVGKSDLNIGWKTTDNGEFFFVHGYYCKAHMSFNHATYIEFNGIKFLSEFKHKNITGFQFHPEKSSEAGLNYLLKFLKANE
jgi:imidazole glycerol phosphate synthase glutamine amidotransferase subunit